ncbi:hypothetical protein [Microvirgula aerodenitrificans]|uniref:hypothetical protein n=1 Tax=Microvirgula aerodenitrificans TaxID=57480 RepID=UPI002F402D0C
MSRILRSLSVVALLMGATAPAFADGQFNSALGGALGGGLGAAIGGQAGGSDGAIIGGALGGALGAAVATPREDVRYIGYRDDDYRRPPPRYDNGWHNGWNRPVYRPGPPRGDWRYDHDRWDRRDRGWDRHDRGWDRHDRGWDRHDRGWDRGRGDGWRHD